MAPDAQAWNLTEAAAVLRTSRWTLYKRRRGNELVFPDGRRIRLFTLGGRYLVSKVVLNRFLEQTGEETA
jgi:hypothetical protein